MSAAPVLMMLGQGFAQSFSALQAFQGAASARKAGGRAASEYDRLGKEAFREVAFIGQQEVGSDKAMYAAAGVNVNRGSPFRERTLKWDRILKAATREQQKYLLYAEGAIAQSERQALRFEQQGYSNLISAGMSFAQALPTGGAGGFTASEQRMLDHTVSPSNPNSMLWSPLLEPVP
jgi:hypothetical protein